MSALERLAPGQRELVRGEVRGLLEKSEAWRNLPNPDRAEIANALVRVVAFMADPNAGQKDLGETALPPALPPVEALAQPPSPGVEKLKNRLADKADFAGKDFDAGAMRAGTESYKKLVDAVDFPKFVGGLIDGVFQSIVTASIKQMDAYGKMLQSVVQSVESFANDNISQNQGRDYLVSRFPGKLKLKMKGRQPMLTARGDDGLEEVGKALGLDQVDLDDEGSEAELVRRARLEMARMRQQQLATMVLLGINRIVVTDGHINARVLIDVTASDEARRTARASMYDEQKDSRTTGGGGWFSDDFTETNQHKAVVMSASDDTSESKAKMKANLTGDVRVQFKSETVPLDKIASNLQIDQLNQRAAPGGGVPSATPAAAPGGTGGRT